MQVMNEWYKVCQKKCFLATQQNSMQSINIEYSKMLFMCMFLLREQATKRKHYWSGIDNCAKPCNYIPMWWSWEFFPKANIVKDASVER